MSDGQLRSLVFRAWLLGWVSGSLFAFILYALVVLP